MRRGCPSDVLSCGSSEKLTSTSDLRDNGCVCSGSEAGHIVDSFRSFVANSDCPVDGVKLGTQKFDIPFFDAAT